MVDNNNLQLNPLVSFIVNCYNGEIYLHSCLSSILAQTYSNWELVFWDNDSTDKSAEIFKSYNDNRFKYFKSLKNETLGQARAWAVNECKGEYIAFLDVDDEWIPEKTEIQIRTMIKEKSILSYGGIIEKYEYSNATKKKTAKHPSKDNFKHNLFQFEIQMPTIMIDRNMLIKKNLNFDPIITASEEYCLCMQLIYKEPVSVFNNPLAKYLITENSLTNRNSSNWEKERIYTLNKIISDHPEIRALYKSELMEAFSRATYYKARSLMISKKRMAALKELKTIKFISLRYFVLFIIAHLPIIVWEKIHIFKNKR